MNRYSQFHFRIISTALHRAQYSCRYQADVSTNFTIYSRSGWTRE